MKELDKTTEKVDNAVMKIKIEALRGQKNWKDYGLRDLRKIAEAERNQAPKIYEQASSASAALSILEKEIGFDKNTRTKQVKTPIETVLIKQDNLIHLVEKRDNARERYANYIIPALQTPFEIWETVYSDGSRRKRYIGIFTGKNDIAVVIKIEPEGNILWNLMNADKARINKFRQGNLLWSK